MHKISKLVFTISLGASLAGCSSSTNSSSAEETSTDTVTITVAAAASLEKTFTDELIPLFEEENPEIKVEGVYDSSGKLQTQIENGLDASVFMSAAATQMDALVSEGYIDADEVIDLVENKLVLIKSALEDIGITSLDEILNANTIAIGDPDIVPAGQYAREALTNLGIYDEVLEKASLGSNVTEVLSWVAAGSAQVGLVYATDAASTEEVEVICEVPEELLEAQVIYPIAPLKDVPDKSAADAFVEFMQSEKALEILAAAGFTINS